MKKIIISLEKKVKNKLLKLKNSHSWEHTERVTKLALHIARKERADVEIVHIASLLHDIGRFAEDNSKGKINHAIYGAKIARKILTEYNISEDIIGKVCHCIQAHRFRSNIRPSTLEAKCLFDADKLDSIGAVGIGRAFQFAGEVGAKLYNKNVKILNTKPYTREDTAYREYMIKLRYIKSMMFTKEGKRLARQRDIFMKNFFIRLDKEINGIV